MLSTIVRIQRASYISVLRSWRTITKPKIYKHSVPTGLIVLALTVVVIARAVSALHSVPGTLKTESPGSQEPGSDYSKFKHDNPNHARLPCLLCHRRENNSARPLMPGSSNHLPCAGCHVKQFADSTNAICTICHSNAQSGALKPFSGLSSFNVKFDHARHLRMGNVGCATCHRPTRGGVALSIPAGFNAHVTCYKCHGPRAKSGDRDISSCGVCHGLGGYVRAREKAPAFRLGFSHAKHDKSEGLTCNECHRVRAAVPRRIQVSAPQSLNHHASPGAFSCISCHNGKRAFGGDDFSVCKRCHLGSAWHF